MRYLDLLKAASNAAERDVIGRRVDEEITAAGFPTPRLMRQALRSAMNECPACVPEDVDDIPDKELPGWLLSHEVDPGDLHCLHPPDEKVI